MNKNKYIIFVGSRDNGIATVSCYQPGEVGKDEAVNLEEYHEYINHSPNGFEWGYSGSGPHQLGFAIIFKTLQMYYDHLSSGAREYLARRIYHKFTQSHIAKMNQATGWALDSRLVENFIIGQPEYSLALKMKEKEEVAN